MSFESITELVLQYRYWILIPLSLIEGPLVAFVAGMLASLDYFNIYFLAALFFVRDVGLDGVYYSIGYFGGRTPFAERMLKRIGVTDDHIEDVRELWSRRPGWTMFIGKLSYGIASAFIVVAGMVRMPLAKFLGYGSIVAVIQYGGLLLVGYFFGASLGGKAARFVENIQYVIAFVAVVTTGYYLFTWYMRRKLLREDRNAQQEVAELRDGKEMKG